MATCSPPIEQPVKIAILHVHLNLKIFFRHILDSGIWLDFYTMNTYHYFHKHRCNHRQ